MPLNKSTIYHQTVQFFVHFFSKKIVFLLSKKKKILKKKILKKIFYSVLPQIYSVLPHFTQFYLVWYSVLPNTPVGGIGQASCGGSCTLKCSRYALTKIF